MNFSNRRNRSSKARALSVLVISFTAIIAVAVFYTAKARTQTAETIRFINVGTEANATILGASTNQHLSGNGAAATFDVNVANVRAHAVAAGDVNNDAITDVVVGAPDATFTVTPAGGSPQTRTNAGVVYIVLGKAGLLGSLDTASQASITILGAASGDKLGFSVAIGDVNGDGTDDIIIGAPGAGFPGSTNPPVAARPNSGAVFVILGGSALNTPHVIDLATANAANIALFGVNTGDQFGASVAVGNVGGLPSQSAADQAAKDILAGAPGNSGPDSTRANGGAAYVVFGGSYLNPVAGATTVRDLANALANVIVFGKAGDLLGFSVAIGDVNAGGAGDLVLGAPLADRPVATLVPPATDTGAVFVVFGGSNLAAVGGTKTFDVLTGQQSVSIYGAGNTVTPGSDDADHLGFSVAVGDVTGDGVVDVLAGAPDADGPGENRPSAGEAYVIQGGAGINSRIDLFNGAATATVFGAASGDRLGATVAAGNYNTPENTDTIPDLIIGAPGANNKAGIVSIVFGGSNLLLINTRDLFLQQDSLRIFGQTSANSDLSNKTLRIKQTLTTSDQSLTPFLQQLVVSVNGSTVVNDDTTAQFGTGTLTNVIAASTVIPNDSTALGDLELAANPALSLDGTTGFISVPSSASLKPGTTNWTVEFWIKRTGPGTGDHPPVIGSRPWTGATDKGWAVELNPSDSFKVSAHFADGTTGFDADAATAVSSTGTALNTWEHWAVVFDRGLGRLSFYRNGALDVTRTPTFPTLAIDQTDTIFIGVDKSPAVTGGPRFLGGNLDDIRVWSVARTAAQIQASFNQELQGNETGLVAYWNFNGGNANDLTANANNGALSGTGATIINPTDRKFLAGNRQSTFTFPASTLANASSISWIQTTPAGTSVKIETSLDNAFSFQTATNGGGIPSLTVGDELGWAIATGDVNKDGGGDLILGAPFANVSAGGAFRAQAGIVYVLPSTAAPPPINHPPIVHLNAPNGGETLFVGQNFNITWVATDPDGDTDIKNFQLKLSTDGGANFNFTINPNVAGTVRQFTWTVPPGFNTTQGRIRVIATDAGSLSAQDDSDGNFTITDAGVTATVTAPNGGENLKFNQHFTITWTVPDAVQSLVKGFDLFLSTDGGGSFSTAIAASSNPAQPAVLPTTRSFDWIVPNNTCTTRARVSIVTTSTANVRTSDASDADFSISALGPTVDTANMFLFGDFQLFLLTTTPAGGTEITFTEDTTVEVSSDAAGTSFFTFSKPPKIKRNGQKFLSKGTINNVDLGVFFPNGATRVIRITRPTCAITILRVTRSGEQLMLAASAQAESATVGQ